MALKFSFQPYLFGKELIFLPFSKIVTASLQNTIVLKKA